MEQKMSPMMVQYLETKKQYPDCILFYRIGDFYEMFFEDAKTASEELELILTGKDCGLDERAPMCGIPFHAADSYISRLVKKGYKVAVGEQVEDPKLAKGLVKREVIRVYTPGTITGTGSLEDKKNNFLFCVSYLLNEYGIAALDVSTGEFYTAPCSSLQQVMEEISRYQPSECLYNRQFLISGVSIEEFQEKYHMICSLKEDAYFDPGRAEDLLETHFHVNINGLGISDLPACISASGAALRYAYDTQFTGVSYVNTLRIVHSSDYMVLDSAAMRNLEILETLREKEKKGSLLWVLDKTKTAVGGRTLRRMISQPLKNRKEIEKRLDAVEELNENFIDREEICEYLRPVYDLERILASISTKRADLRDLLAVKSSLEMIPHIRRVLSGFHSEALMEIREQLPELPELKQLLTDALCEEAPSGLRDGGLIKEGYSEEADRLRSAGVSGKQWLYELEASEREKTGIRSLKVKYNKVFGYCIEVSNSFKNEVPDYFIRKQTLVNGERYTTEKLEELADTILGAEDRLKSLEYEIFCEIRDRTEEESESIRKIAASLGQLDALCSLSQVALRNHYVRPKFNDKGQIKIQDGRHPVIELMQKEGSFVPNDTILDKNSHRISIITGPNMAGKSTYMRQTALIVIMAQIGSFVPAYSADLCVCDRVFTRVGASDDLAQGRSTFMVEMTEVASILRNATENSLLILDEIGRGTSTYDGLSIAWAVVEYISNKKKIGAKTLFATHYHELTELEGKIDGVQNYCIAVKETENGLVFLRKIIPGGADRSYGIAVAKLAGVPEEVTRRAQELAAQLEASDITHTSGLNNQVSLAPEPENKTMHTAEQKALEMIRGADTSRLTPIEALLMIDQLKGML